MPEVKRINAEDLIAEVRRAEESAIEMVRLRASSACHQVEAALELYGQLPESVAELIARSSSIMVAQIMVEPMVGGQKVQLTIGNGGQHLGYYSPPPVYTEEQRNRPHEVRALLFILPSARQVRP